MNESLDQAIWQLSRLPHHHQDRANALDTGHDKLIVASTWCFPWAQWDIASPHSRTSLASLPTDDPSLVTKCLAIILTNAVQLSAVQCGAIVETLRAHTALAVSSVASQQVVELACQVLSKFTEHSASMMVLLVEADGLGVVICAMQDLPNNDIVAEHGCAILRYLARDDRNKLPIAEMGGIHAVIFVMYAHAANARVAIQGCGLLWNLAANAANRLMIAQEGGIDATISVLGFHASQSNVATNALRALTCLAVDVANRVTIATGGGIAVILFSMRACLSSASVSEHGCGALINITLGNAENNALVVQAGGIENILSAMRAHPNNAGVAANGCSALQNLASDGGNQVAIAQAGGIAVVVAAMQLYPDSVEVADCGCGACYCKAQRVKVELQLHKEVVRVVLAMPFISLLAT